MTTTVLVVGSKPDYKAHWNEIRVGSCWIVEYAWEMVSEVGLISYLMFSKVKKSSNELWSSGLSGSRRKARDVRAGRKLGLERNSLRHVSFSSNFVSRPNHRLIIGDYCATLQFNPSDFKDTKNCECFLMKSYLLANSSCMSGYDKQLQSWNAASLFQLRCRASTEQILN